jgi:hypothetical protein
MADQDGNEGDEKRKISRSAKLPLHGFESIRPQVQALSDLAAPSTKERIAEQLGVSAKGRFNGKLAAASYFGFIKRGSDGRLHLTDRGRAFLSEDADAQTQAQREGVMETSFGPIIFLLRSQEPKEKVIAARLQDDVGVPPASAEATAKTMIGICKEAKLIGENGRFSASAIEDTQSALPAPEPAQASAPPKPRLKPATERPSRRPAKEWVAANEERQQPRSEGKNGPLAVAPVQVVVNVDASKLSAEGIAELVRALRATREAGS